MTHTFSFSGIRVLSCFFSTLLIAGLVASEVRAEPRYIKPNLEVAVRKTQSTNGKILETLPMGAPAELVQSGKEWSLVRIRDGKKGWIRTQYLSTTPILPVEDFTKVNGPEGIFINIQKRFTKLSQDNKQLKQDLAVCITDRSTLADKYQTLVGDPNSVLYAKTSLGEAQKQIEELQKKLTDTQIENAVLRKNQAIKWFLTGSGVLLGGLSIGLLIAGKNKRKRSSLL